jgi:anti-sigma factor RsiW
MTLRVTEAELHAYADDALPPARRSAVEAHLASHRRDAERISTWREQRAKLHLAFDHVLDEPLPERLAALPLVPLAPSRVPLALAAAVLALGIAIGWFGRGLLGRDSLPSAPTLARQAAVAHAVYVPEVRHPVEVAAAEHDHLVKWLSKRLGSDLRVPNLAARGFELVGGRLLPGEAGPVAQLMYQDARGHRLTLYVTRSPANRDTAFRFSQEGRVGVLYWIDQSLGYALSAELPREELAKLASTVHSELNP